MPEPVVPAPTPAFLGVRDLRPLFPGLGVKSLRKLIREHGGVKLGRGWLISVDVLADLLLGHAEPEDKEHAP